MSSNDLPLLDDDLNKVESNWLSFVVQKRQWCQLLMVLNVDNIHSNVC